jgi:hypothetical protein
VNNLSYQESIKDMPYSTLLIPAYFFFFLLIH